MTAAEEEEAPSEANPKQAIDIPTISEEISNIFEFLSFNEKIVFKSQQIDDPELERSEKVQIAREIFERSQQVFLQRFGAYLEEHHLGAIWNEENIGDEVEEMLLEFRKRLQTRKRDVKNRRYAAMQDLIKKGDYFSELEMMNRAPEIYQELVGQYLSEEEIKQRDSYDVKNTTFSNILMHTLEQQQRDKMLKEADAILEQEEELETEKINEKNGNAKTELGKLQISSARNSEFIVEEDEESEFSLERAQIITSIGDEYEVPISCRQQWGNFDNETVACSTSCLNKPSEKSQKALNKSISNKLITAGERDLLRQEFVGLMHERFLAGKDSNFDYSLIDDNSQLDDLSQLNQDKEDAYFDTSEDETEEMNMITAEDSDLTDSEDELDIYMRHLNQHHSLRT